MDLEVLDSFRIESEGIDFIMGEGPVPISMVHLPPWFPCPGLTGPAGD